MYNAIDVRCVADVAEIHFKLQEFLNAFWRQSQAGTFWKVIDKCVDFRKVYRTNKEFHIVYLKE